MIETSGHLPECYRYGSNTDVSPCICDRLRACELRVVQACREAVRNTPCPDGYEVKGCSHWDDALAAIDALKGEQ